MLQGAFSNRRLPDRESLALVRALARAQGIPEDTIVCGAGASDIIWRLAAAVRPETHRRVRADVL